MCYGHREAAPRCPVPEYIFQAVERARNGDVLLMCHDSQFAATDTESAIVTANALFEIIPVSDRCNRIEVLDPFGNRLWSRAIEESEHGL